MTTPVWSFVRDIYTSVFAPREKLLLSGQNYFSKLQHLQELSFLLNRSYLVSSVGRSSSLFWISRRVRVTRSRMTIPTRPIPISAQKCSFTTAASASTLRKIYRNQTSANNSTGDRCLSKTRRLDNNLCKNTCQINGRYSPRDWVEYLWHWQIMVQYPSLLWLDYYSS